MHIGVICSPDFLQKIRDELSEHQILFEHSGHFQPEEFDALCTAAINVSLDMLVVDMTCADDDAIVKGLRKYRITKSSRVIVIAPGRSPGDLTMSKLVADGIYDILAPGLPEEGDEAFSFDFDLGLQIAVKQEYHMGNAARWRVYQDEESNQRQRIKLPDIDFSKIREAVFSGRKEGPRPAHASEPLEDDLDLFDDEFFTPPGRTEVIERIVGTVTIAVFSGLKRTGCSFNALQIAHWLSQKYRTPYVEMEQKTSEFFRTFESERKTDSFNIGNLSIYPGKREIEELLFEDWEYVVIDFGTHWKEHLNSFARCHIHVLSAFSCDMDATADLLSDLYDRNWKRPIHLVVTATDKGFKEWTETVTRKERKELQLTFWQQTLLDGPFQDGILPIQDILGSVLPKKKRGLFKFFKGRGTT